MSTSQDEAEAAPNLSRADSLLFKIETAFNMLAALAVFLLMLLGVVQVVGRKVFNFPIFGYVDMVEQAIAIFAFLGVAYCQKLGGHVRMDLFLGMLRGRPLWLTEGLGILIAMFIVTVLIFTGYDHFSRAFEYGDSTIDAEYPVWPSKLLVPIAFAMLWLRLLIQLIGYGRLALKPDAKPVAVPLIARVEEQAKHEIEEALGKEARAPRDD
ncbi:MAG: TRAP transporter small permease [Alphaproteobacteria bacterium]